MVVVSPLQISGLGRPRLDTAAESQASHRHDDGLQRFKDLGVTHFSLRFGWPGTPRELVEGTMRLAAAEVLPALR